MDKRPCAKDETESSSSRDNKQRYPRDSSSSCGDDDSDCTIVSDSPKRVDPEPQVKCPCNVQSQAAAPTDQVDDRVKCARDPQGKEKSVVCDHGVECQCHMGTLHVSDEVECTCHHATESESEVCDDDDETSNDALLYLQKFNDNAGDTLFNHLKEVLTRILDERPKDPFASFDLYSKRLRAERFRLDDCPIRELYTPPPQYDIAKRLVQLFTLRSSTEEECKSVSYGEEGEEEELELEGSMVDVKPQLFPKLQELFCLFQQADVGLPRADLVFLDLSIRRLAESNRKVRDVRFWGKILGSPKSYYVLEAFLTPEELGDRLEELERTEQQHCEDEDDCRTKCQLQQELENFEAKERMLFQMMTEKLKCALRGTDHCVDEFDLKLPPFPKSSYVPSMKIAEEKLGTGANSKVYLVCNSPGLDDWVELPSVTPKQIQVARQVVHLFTGNLEQELHTFPPYPGCEKNYLRAQIARIGAATHVSPVGFFVHVNLLDVDEDEEEIEEEDEEEREVEADAVTINPEYERPTLKELTDPAMTHWVHHAPYLLEQGRVTWCAPGQPDVQHSDTEEEDDDDDDEEGEEEEVATSASVEREIAPPLLTPLSKDASSEGCRPWTARQSSRGMPDAALAVLRSNVWPGACTFAVDKRFSNIYIGWGHKYRPRSYGPAQMPPVQGQYAPDAEFVETADPTFREEEAWRIAREEEEAEGAEEEEEEEELDDTEYETEG